MIEDRELHKKRTLGLEPIITTESMRCPKCDKPLESTQSTNENGIGTYGVFCSCGWYKCGMLDDD